MSKLGRIVIVGAGAAGLACCEELRTLGYGGAIELIGHEEHLPYDRPPLSKKVLSGEWPWERTFLKDKEFYRKIDVALHLGSQATAVNSASQIVHLDNGALVPYDRLVIATGVVPKRIAAVGGPSRLHVIRTIGDVAALQDDLRGTMEVAIVGAGILGMEIACTLKMAGHEVTVFDGAPGPMLRQLGTAVGQRVAQLHRANGVKLAFGVYPTAIQAMSPAGHRLELSDGSACETDIVVVAIGSDPSTGWLAGSGVPIGNGVLCDSFCMATEHVYAAGDVANWPHPYYARRMRLEHRQNASEQGVTVARNILGHGLAYNPVPFFWTDQFNVKIQAYGVLDADCDISFEVGALEDSKFVAAFRKDGQLMGVLGWNAIKDLRPFRQMIAQAILETPAYGQRQ